MKLIDLAKAAGVGVVILIVNIAISIVAVLVYSIFINPGHPREYYDDAAKRIAPWCSHIAGTALFLVAGYYFARHAPQRNPYLFVLLFTVLYAFIDAAIVGFKGIWGMSFALSMLAKLAAGMLGAFLAQRNELAAQ